jgi:AcrR family transcriptional regulator
MTKTQKQIQSEQTRQEIIAAASLLFTRKGFFGTSIADLAKATGLTKGALYHHFENKDAIFFAVVESVRRTWNDQVARDVLSHKDAKIRLTALIENHTRLLFDNEHLCLLLNGLMMEMDDVKPEFLAVLLEIYEDLTQFIQTIIEKGQDSEQIRPDLDARLTALNIVGMLRGIGCSPVFKQMEVDYGDLAATLNQILLSGLEP